MDPIIISQLESYIQSAISTTGNISLETDSAGNIFDRFIEQCQLYYDRPAHSIGEIKNKLSKKVKGDVFEHFAYLYFSKVKCWETWFLKDLPKDIRTKLKLAKVDLGIDLIARSEGKYYAIQAKYRKKGYKPKTILGWKQLSTFYGIVSKTGPWYKHIVFSNCDYIRHVGTKTIKDKSMCIGTLRKIKREEWEAMLSIQGHSCSSTKLDSVVNVDEKPKVVKLSIEELREKRLLALASSTLSSEDH